MKFIPYASSSNGNFYQLAGDNGSRLLLECGIPISDIKMYLDFDLSNIAGCLLTHAHLDHAKSAREIMYHGVDLYCSYGTAEKLDLSGHRLHIIKAMEQFSIGEWVIVPFEAEHDAPEPLSFLISNGPEKMVFATDTFYIKPQFKSLSLVAVEANWSEATINPNLEPSRKKRLMESHMSLETLKGFLTANDLTSVKEIHLLHLSDSNSDAEMFESEIQSLTGIPTFVAPRRA